MGRHDPQRFCSGHRDDRERGNLAERHVRFLIPLAYLSPRIIEAIAEGRAPADQAVTRLVRNLPTVWADQEKQLGFA